MTTEDGDEHWTLPAVGTIKINTAAIFETTSSYSFSLVARKHWGEVVDVSVKCNLCRILPDMADDMGIREALSWKTHEGRGYVIETDMGSVQATRSSSLKLSYLGRVIEDCRNLLAELKDRPLRLVRRSRTRFLTS